jgi:hypothetical protein
MHSQLCVVYRSSSMQNSRIFARGSPRGKMLISELPKCSPPRYVPNLSRSKKPMALKASVSARLGVKCMIAAQLQSPSPVLLLYKVWRYVNVCASISPPTYACNLKMTARDHDLVRNLFCSCSLHVLRTCRSGKYP